MGGCCTREQDIHNDKLSSIHYSAEDILNVDIRSVAKPEIRLESIKLVKSKEEMQLDLILDSLIKIFKGKTRIITTIDLFNLSIFYKDNALNNKYIIYDMRRSCEQKEDYLKKMKHVNYSYDQIKNIKKIRKFENLQKFLNNKIVILIISEYFLNTDNNKEGYKKMEDFPFELIKLLFGVNSSINFLLLNSSLNHKEMPAIFQKYENFLGDVKSNDNIPYILFTYKHVNTFYIEGYFFIHFLPKSVLSFEDFINNYNNNTNNDKAVFDNKKSIEINNCAFNNNFIKNMKICTIVTIDNISLKNHEMKEFQFRTAIFKEFTINKKNIVEKNEIIKTLCDWIKKEINKGHSCYFNVENFDNIEGTGGYDWLFIIIVLMSIITGINYTDVVNYLKNKINYVTNIDEFFEDCINNEFIEDFTMNI